MQDLVPCVLISFEREHILIWRGPHWKSSIEPAKILKPLEEVKTDLAPTSILNSEKHDDNDDDDVLEKTISPTSSNEPDISVIDDPSEAEAEAEACSQTTASEIELNDTVKNTEAVTKSSSVDLGPSLDFSCTEGVMLLRKRAVEKGMAVVLDHDSLDADIVFKEAVAFAKTAPMGPRYPHRSKQLAAEKDEQRRESDESRVKEATVDKTPSQLMVASRRRDDGRKNSTSRKMEDIKADYLNIVPQGNLRVDELAKLLS